MSNNNNTVSNRLTRWSHMTRYRRCIETQCRPPQADEDCCKGGGGGETRVGSDLTTPLSPVKLTWRQLWSRITARDSEEEPVMSLPLSTMKVHSGTHLPEHRGNCLQLHMQTSKRNLMREEEKADHKSSSTCGFLLCSWAPPKGRKGSHPSIVCTGSTDPSQSPQLRPLRNTTTTSTLVQLPLATYG